jgi:hypothetical protein
MYQKARKRSRFCTIKKMFSENTTAIGGLAVFPILFFGGGGDPSASAFYVPTFRYTLYIKRWNRVF